MLWRGRRESSNIEDRGGMGARAGGMGVVGLLFGAFMVYLMGGNPLAYLAQNAGSVQPSAQVSGGETRSEARSFVAVVLADTEDVWTTQFRKEGREYAAPKLVLFRGSVQSACGSATSASGPFYCPADQRVYLDLSFLNELASGLGAGGDFAAAYVIAHEVGHHVQNLLGLEERFRDRQQSMSRGERNQASVNFELQADCLAGVWAKDTETSKQVVEAGDIDEAVRAAGAVGDDRLQQRSQGYVVPDSFTHGSSDQRVAAFRQGYDGGIIGACVP